MAGDDPFRRYREIGAFLGQLTRARAEELVRELTRAGEPPREHAQEWVDDLLDRGRRATDGLFQMIRSEVANQLDALGIEPEDLARRAADLLRRSGRWGHTPADSGDAGGSGGGSGSGGRGPEPHGPA
ncbi:MAG: hypothetical protein ACRDY3_11825, partial [Acidimicrobiales bacterium]